MLNRVGLAVDAWPRPEDREHAALLAGLFYGHELNGVRHGYDPFGRLIVHSPTADAFAVAWPADPTTPAVADLALAAYRFAQVDDGRVDLVPLTTTRAADKAEDSGIGDPALTQVLRRLPADHRPPPDLAAYDRLLAQPDDQQE